MRLIVWVPDWQLEENQRVLSVGEELSSWLTFEEAEALTAPERIQTLHGVAHPLPSWPGAALQTSAVRVDVEGAVLYWDAPRLVEGPVDLVGAVSRCVTDAPDGFPTTRLVIRAARMEWQPRVHDGIGTWLPEGAPHYEDVATTYLPRREVAPGAALTDWSGVLLDVETVGLAEA